MLNNSLYISVKLSAEFSTVRNWHPTGFSTNVINSALYCIISKESDVFHKRDFSDSEDDERFWVLLEKQKRVCES